MIISRDSWRIYFSQPLIEIFTNYKYCIWKQTKQTVAGVENTPTLSWHAALASESPLLKMRVLYVLYSGLYRPVTMYIVVCQYAGEIFMRTRSWYIYQVLPFHYPAYLNWCIYILQYKYNNGHHIILIYKYFLFYERSIRFRRWWKYFKPHEKLND